MHKPDEKKDGVTVEQLEHFGKKHHVELFFSIIFILASIFSMLFYGPGWSIYAAGIGGIVAVWIPKAIEKAYLATFKFCSTQQKATCIVVAVAGLILSIFVPPLIFLFIGMMAGKGFVKFKNIMK